MTGNALALGLGFLSLIAIVPRAHLPEVGPALVLLGLLTMALELDAIPVPPRGLFSTGFAPALALALLPTQGPAAGAAALLAGTGLRVPLTGRQENLASLTPALTSLAVAGWMPGPALPRALATSLTFVALSLVWPACGRRELERFRLGTILLLGPATAFLAQVSPWACLLPAPLLAGAHHLTRIYGRRMESTMVGRAGLQARERKTRAELDKAGHALELASERLEAETLQRRLVRELPAELAACESVQGVLDTILATLVQLVEVRQAAIYLQADDPLVKACLASGKVQAEGDRVAIPLQREGALVVEGKFSQLDGRLLTVLAGAGGLGIQSARRYAEGQATLEEHRRAHARLKVWVERLAFLLESARQLTSGLEPREILQRLKQILQVTLPHRQSILLSPGERREGWTNAPILSERGEQAVVALDCEIPFTAEQLDVLTLLCHQAGVALHNATLHQEAIDAQEQLVQSSKLAAVGQLAAGVAHELNTPLCAALVAIEMARLDLESGELTEAQSKLETAETAGARCQEIIGKLLYYARDAALTETEAELNQIVRDTLELLGRQLRPEGLKLEVELAEPMSSIRVDCHELQQVVSNLLLNARDAVLSGGEKTIRVTTREVKPWVELVVSDRGPGIEPTQQDKVFEPFFTTKPAGQGTGLGLSVSRDIVTRHGGTLTVASVPGQGAAFCLRLPALQ